MDPISKEKFLKYVQHHKKTIDTKPKDLKASYKKRDEYYAKAYDALVMEKRSFYWNWPAALFWPFWLLYRRMYIEAFFAIFAATLLNWIFSSVFPINPASHNIALILFSIIISVLFGLFGTSLYIHCIKKRIEDSKNIPSTPVDFNIVLLVLVLPFFVYMVIAILDISPENKDIFEFFAGNLYFLALALYKYLKARYNNIV